MLCAAIAGHIGVGHADSHMGLVQDDAVGFSALVSILMRIRPVDLTVEQVSVKKGEVQIVLRGGGQGRASFSGPVSVFEQRLLSSAEGLCELSSQTLATRVLGRTVGQGVARLSSVFALAHARAVLRAIQRAWPDDSVHYADDTPGSCGEFLGGKLQIGTHAYGWLLTINASADGSGPVEDSEGIVPVGNKGRLMQELGMASVPFIVLESKACSPGVSESLASTTPWIRWNNDVDNPVVGECLVRAARQLGYELQVHDMAYVRRRGEMQEATARLGRRICQLGQAYAEAASSMAKVRIAGELAELLAHEAGGTSFMSSCVHDIAGGGGLWPGQAAVLSLLASRCEYENMGAVVTGNEEINALADIVMTALPMLAERLPEAQRFIHERRPDIGFESLLQEIRKSADGGR